jgi:hypothetical protein
MAEGGTKAVVLLLMTTTAGQRSVLYESVFTTEQLRADAPALQGEVAYVVGRIVYEGEDNAPSAYSKVCCA